MAVCQWRIWALAAYKYLARRSGPKKSPKSPDQKSAIATNYEVKHVFIKFFFRLRFSPMRTYRSKILLDNFTNDTVNTAVVL